MELVEIQFEHVKIPEQNLSTFFFYKAFIKENLLSVQTLLENFFESNTNRFRDSIIPAYYTFGPQKVMATLKPDLLTYWNKIKKEDDKAFLYLDTFWYYLQTEALEFLFTIVEHLPTDKVSAFEVAYENNAFAYNKDKIIELLGEFFKISENLKHVIELAFEYVKRKPKQLPELIHKVKEQLTFDKEDKSFNFQRQTILFNIIINGLNKDDRVFIAAFYELSKTFLSFKFNHTRGGRNHSFYWYDYPIPNIQPVHDFRKMIWDALESNYSKHPIESFRLLENYAAVSPDVVKEVMEFDLPFILNIIEKHLNTESFEHCKYVQDQIRWCKRNSIIDPAFSSLGIKFINKTYKIFLKIDWNRLRDKEMFEFDNIRDYDKLKEAEIRASFRFKSLSGIKEFYSQFVYLKNISKNDWNYMTTLDLIIDENFLINNDLGYQILLIIIENGNEINYVPRTVFRNQLKTIENAKRIWSFIHGKEYKYKNEWELSFYSSLDDSLITKEYVDALINTIAAISESSILYLDSSQSF